MNTDTEKLAQALRTIQYSMQQAQIPGNDSRREIKLTANICEQALAAHDTARAQPASEFASDKDAYESNAAEGIWTAGINAPHPKLGRWDAKIECHGESKESAERLRDTVLAALQAQPASMADGFKTALEQIKALPLRPFPDPVGHSWEAFGRAVMGAFTDARMTAAHALDAAPQPASVADWTDEQCIRFMCVGLRHVQYDPEYKGRAGPTVDEIRQGVRAAMESAPQPPAKESE
jgi:hypothetical protein